jgi:hypothetical protein
MDVHEVVLISEQATSILSRTSLIEIYTKAASHQPNQVQQYLFVKLSIYFD